MFRFPFAYLDISRVLNASPETVWKLITDTRRWPEWGLSVKAVECAEARIRKGSTGWVQTALGLWVVFRVTEFEEGRYWAWRVSGVPATGHRIEPLELVRCRLTFEVPTIAAPYALVCHMALDRIARLAEDAAK
jgi:uncharacterized protein YndB with AHSA1/START domain